ncbi:MAG: MFS transporter [Pseudomonadota bacterium]
MSETTRDKVFELLTADGDERVCKDIPDSACREEPKNFSTHITALSASKIADGLVDPKLVLSWLLTTMGAPAAFIGLLVPIREAGALLPQIFTAAWLRRLPKRKWAWSMGALVQGLSALAMGVAAVTLTGAALGVAIVAALTTLALARSICSVTYKDVLGKTVSKSRRGTATGAASSIAAATVLAFGALLATTLLPRIGLVSFGLFAAGMLWIVGALIFANLQEAAGATEGGGNAFKDSLRNFTLLRDDPQLRYFILTRGLLISTALAPPFMVSLGVKAGRGDVDDVFGGLGLLIIASATAGLLSSYIWGRLADKSSRWVLIASALAACAALIVTLILHHTGLLEDIWALPLVLFGLMIAYQGVRLGRSTHLVDMATEETRAPYTALSNTLIGLLLMIGGIFSWVASVYGESIVIGLFAVMSGGAALTGLQLEEVQS